LHLEVTLSGRGVAGSEGKLHLSVNNPSDLPIELVRLELSRDNVYFDLAETIDAMSPGEVELTWASWPSSQELANLQVKLHFCPPNRDIQIIAVIPSLESEELYVKDDILGDLGGLDEF
jgi:hypothetical protein